jgi:hypothetical protein
MARTLAGEFPQPCPAFEKLAETLQLLPSAEARPAGSPRATVRWP